MSVTCTHALQYGTQDGYEVISKGGVYSTDMLGIGTIHVLLGRLDSKRFHHASRRVYNLKFMNAFSPGIFNLIFSDHG